MTNIEQKTLLNKQVRRKALTQAFVIPLRKQATRTHKHVKQLTNAYYCADEKIRDGNKLTSTYCKTRMCHTCNAIRCAKLINGYETQLKPLIQRNNLYFITLTRRTVHYTQAEQRLNEMTEWWRAYKKKQSQERRRNVKKGFCSIFDKKVKGIRKLEATVRPNMMIHWHYHIIIEGQANAQHLKDAWLADHPQDSVEQAQDVRKADAGCFQELFKYLTKPSYKDSEDDDAKDKLIPDEQASKAFNAIFNACYRRRLVQPFGGLRYVEEAIEDDDIEAQELDEGLQGEMWLWHREVANYISEYGEFLAPEVVIPPKVTGYLATAESPPRKPWDIADKAFKYRRSA